MLNKTIKTAAALAVAGLALPGCKPATPAAAKIEPPVDKTTSAYACSGEESLATVKQIIRQEAQKSASADAAGLDDASVDRLMEISLVTISSAEPEIKKVTCEAQFGIRVPPGAQEALANKNLVGNFMSKDFSGAMAIPQVPAELARGDGSTISITYSRQRSANDQDYVFSVYDVGPMALALLRASSAVHRTPVPSPESAHSDSGENQPPLPSQIKLEQPYSVARASLIASGYVPATYQSDDEYHDRQEICEDADGKECTQYPELYDCSGGVRSCDFSFHASDGSILFVVTQGEIRPKVANIRWATPSEIAERNIVAR